MLLMLLAGASLATYPARAHAASIPASVEVCFSPPLAAGCDPERTIIATVASARKEILVQAYELSARGVVDALADARRRGVEVRVILDRSALRDNPGEPGGVNQLIAAGAAVMVDVIHNGIAHNKVMIIDGATVLTGSFNFTRAAETRNAENLVVIRSAEVAAQYIANWKGRAAIATAITRAEPPKPPPYRRGHSMRLP
jgi:phosphatidylserine/phosphatidylglycerophosphate/cardiolipin synthase-like enzyme